MTTETIYVAETTRGYQGEVSAILYTDGRFVLLARHICSCDFECWADHAYCFNFDEGECEDGCVCPEQDCDCEFECEDNEHEQSVQLELTEDQRAALIQILLTEHNPNPNMPSQANPHPIIR